MIISFYYLFIYRDKTNKADTNVSRSVSSLQSDPSGLFLNGSPDRHSVISDDLSFKESEVRYLVEILIELDLKKK